jgi:hypothetical protein
MSGPEVEARNHALLELADAGEQLRALETALDQGDLMGEESGPAESALERYLSALARARRLAR